MANFTNSPSPTQRFKLGTLVITPGAELALYDDFSHVYLFRHLKGDWGDVCDDDKHMNDAAIAHEGDPDRQCRVLSAYITRTGDKIWIITEADRSTTTVLTPDEY